MKLYFHGFRSALALVLAVTTFVPALSINASPLPMPPQQLAQTTSKKVPKEEVDSFIIESFDGSTKCRGARDEEVASTLPKHGHVGVPVDQLVASAIAPGGDNAENGLTIDFDQFPQLLADPNRAVVVAAFERAAAVWTARIKNPISIRVNIEYGINAPGGGTFGPNTLGSTSSLKALVDYPGARTNLIAAASSAAEAAIYQALPAGSVIPVDDGNGAVVGVNRSVAFALGIPVVAPSNLNVATIAFNKNFSFDFNPDNGITPGQTDFVAVATHEIGHALGFTSGAGTGHAGNISLWDLYRFRPGMSSGTFASAPRIMTMGGQQTYFTGQSFNFDGFPVTELGLSTGGPDGDFGDFRQSSHWKDDELATGYVGIMDPTISAGVLEETTENDFMGLEALGWNLVATAAPPPAPPPPPVPANDNFSSAQVITGCSGSVNGTNIGASREGGELNHLSTLDQGGGSRSVWYQWQAPVTGSVTISTAGSRYDTILGIYTGTAVNALAGTIVGQHDDVVGPNGDDRTSRLTFNADAGFTYRIAVDGYNNQGSNGDIGPVTLNWNQSNCESAWAPTVLTPSQVELKSWQVIGRTFVYAKLTFPDAGFRVSNWGTATGVGNAFSSDALVERFNGASAQAITSTAQIWDLGALVPGGYSFAFKNSGTTVKTLNFTVSGTPPAPNPIDDARTFVFWQYKDFLRRDPDGPGWDHWTGEITMCTNPANRRPGETEAQCVDRKRENTSAAFFVSPESSNTGYFVLRVYRGSLGRMPFFGATGSPNDEFTRDVGTVSQGIVVNNALSPAVINANKQAFVNQFVTRTDFRAIYDGLNNTQYVDRLFQTTGVTPTAGERQALIDGLSGAETRASVLFKIVDGTTTTTGGVLQFNTVYGKAFYDNLFNEAFVHTEYFGYLQRDPDAEGKAFWLGKLNTFGDWVNAEMVKAFINSPEYRSRFGAP